MLKVAKKPLRSRYNGGEIPKKEKEIYITPTQLNATLIVENIGEI